MFELWELGSILKCRRTRFSIIGTALLACSARPFTFRRRRHAVGRVRRDRAAQRLRLRQDLPWHRPLLHLLRKFVYDRLQFTVHLKQRHSHGPTFRCRQSTWWEDTTGIQLGSRAATVTVSQKPGVMILGELKMA